MDWNHDGKHDWKDDAFFHNVVMKDSEKETRDKNCNHTSSGSSSSNSNNGIIWFIVLCVVYFIVKLIA